MNAKIYEIFESIQGEGPHVGIRQVFVRFYECNIHCSWCDTPASIGDAPGEAHFKEYSAQELINEILKLDKNCSSVSLTGGEPLVQADFLKEFLPILKKSKIQTYLETNGIFYKELAQIIADVDVVAMDIKLPSSAKTKAFWKEHEEFLKIALKRDCFIKVVISGDTLKEEVLQSAQIVSRICPQMLFILQPNYFEMKNGVVKKCLEFQQDCLKLLPHVRVMPQVHKFIKLR